VPLAEAPERLEEEVLVLQVVVVEGRADEALALKDGVDHVELGPSGELSAVVDKRLADYVCAVEDNDCLGAEFYLKDRSVVLGHLEEFLEWAAA